MQFGVRNSALHEAAIFGRRYERVELLIADRRECECARLCGRNSRCMGRHGARIPDHFIFPLVQAWEGKSWNKVLDKSCWTAGADVNARTTRTSG